MIGTIAHERMSRGDAQSTLTDGGEKHVVEEERDEDDEQDQRARRTPFVPELS